MWTIDLELIESWLIGLGEDTYDQVMAAIELLEEHGPQLGRPIVDTVKASKYKNMKELRPGSAGRTELRILFAFDPQRQAIMLIAGDKAGNWKKWYRDNIPIADEQFTAHLVQLKTKNTEIEGRWSRWPSPPNSFVPSARSTVRASTRTRSRCWARYARTACASSANVSASLRSNSPR